MTKSLFKPEKDSAMGIFHHGVEVGRQQIIDQLIKIAEDNYEFPGDWDIHYGVTAALDMILGVDSRDVTDYEY